MNIGKRVVEILIQAKDAATPDMKKIGQAVSALTQQFPALSIIGGLAIKDLVGKLVDLGRAAVQAYQDTVRLGAGFVDMSARTELSVETLAKWKFIAEQGGSSIEEFEAAFRKLRKTMADAVTGEQTAIDTFDRLGVAYRDMATGGMRDLETVMLEIGQAIREHGVASVQGAAGQEALGRSSAAMVSILKQQSSELEAQMTLAKAYTSSMTTTWANTADAADDAAQRAKTASENIRAALMPDLSGVRQWWTETFIMMFNAKGWVQLQKANEEAARLMGEASAAATLDGYVAGLVDTSGAAAGVFSDNTKRLAEQIAKDKSLAELRDKIAEAMTPPKSTGAVDEDWTSIGTDSVMLLEDYADAMLELQTVAEALAAAGTPAVMDAEKIAAGDEALRRLIESQYEFSDSSLEMSDMLYNAKSGFENLASSAIQAFAAGEAGAMRFGTMLRQMVVQVIAEAIAKMLVLKALSALTGGLFESGGRIPEFAHGGTIPRAALGYAVPDGPRGMDSRLIAAMPGEEVINRQLSQRLDRFLGSMEFGAAVSPFALSGAGGGRGNVTVNFEVGRPVSVLDSLSYGEAATTAARKVAEANL